METMKTREQIKTEIYAERLSELHKRRTLSMMSSNCKGIRAELAEWVDAETLRRMAAQTRDALRRAEDEA